MVPTTARARRSGLLLLLLLPHVLAAAAALGCGAATPRLDAGVYRSGPIAFRIGDVPSPWRPVSVDGATLSYRDDANRASVLLDARCSRKDDDVPLVALTFHLVMGTTDREIASQETIPFDGREAMHTRLRAKQDGVAQDYDIYVLKKDGCVYDFVYVADPATADAGAPAFERFVGTFHTLPGSGVVT
jgi:hypothetical protein